MDTHEPRSGPEQPFVPPELARGDAVDLAPLSWIDFAFDGHYDVLGVSRTATGKQIADAYFEQVAILDRLGRQGADDPTVRARHAALHKAKDILATPEKRAEYDREANTEALSIADPPGLPRLDLLEGLRLIARAVGPERPERDGPLVVDERPNPILEQLLR